MNRRLPTRNVADLARAGFEIARQPLTKVDFEVHHIADRAGYLRQLARLGQERGEADAVFLETLSSGANGGGVAIGTHTRNPVESVAALEQRDGQNRPARPEQDDGGWIFHQTAWPNPTFIYESARTFEGLIAIDLEPSELTKWHGKSVRNLMQAVSEAAANLAGAPLLTLQCPAQLPPSVKTRNHDLRTRKELPSVCSAPAIRFSIALNDSSAERRFLLSDRIRQLCDERGYGFWIADTRPAHRPGNWFEVCRPAKTRTIPPEDSATVTTCLPVTCAGPARVGSTHAIVRFLRRYPGVGVVSCSGTSLADVAFVHLQLSIDDAVADVSAERVNKILLKLSTENSAQARPREFLRDLFGRLGLRADRRDRGQPRQTDPASDYQTFVGPAFDYRRPSAFDWVGLWFSWQIARKADGLAGPIECLYRALERVVPSVALAGVPPRPLSEVASTEYLVCRATEQSVVRGKGKLAVPRPVLAQFGSNGTEAPVSELCVALEEAWRSELAMSNITGLSELTVAWRESWLGHYTIT
ncbi:hypothetical protein [Amycolatopsis sp. CA-230715]|uniref:hypothetical protein n=1 Tax=Amycolatopsis sp. CA-230715 TaxID=2745196 RepID=UPI001C0276B3|nr:hypothetical protein [Amycolatopsis sp. CA-230715]QWF80069.1 hypothetical protein HUW46_03484 [Amycolatopsis sp. CA-230715]